jgi:hypothetical protein
VTIAEDVTVRVRKLVESSSVVEVRVELTQGADVVPMGSTDPMVVPAVPVSVGREPDMVWFQPSDAEKLPGAVRAVEVGQPCGQGSSVEVELTQGPWLLWLLMGIPETLESSEEHSAWTVTVVGMQVTLQEVCSTVTVDTSVVVTVAVTPGWATEWPPYMGKSRFPWPKASASEGLDDISI